MTSYRGSFVSLTKTRFFHLASSQCPLATNWIAWFQEMSGDGWAGSRRIFTNEYWDSVTILPEENQKSRIVTFDNNRKKKHAHILFCVIIHFFSRFLFANINIFAVLLRPFSAAFLELTKYGTASLDRSCRQGDTLQNAIHGHRNNFQDSEGPVLYRHTRLFHFAQLFCPQKL